MISKAKLLQRFEEIKASRPHIKVIAYDAIIKIIKEEAAKAAEEDQMLRIDADDMAMKIAHYFRCMFCKKNMEYLKCYTDCRYFLSGYEAVMDILEGKK